MEVDDSYTIPDTPAFNNVLLGEINSNLSDIKKLLQQISDQQKSVKVEDLNITFGSMFGLALKWVVVTFFAGLIILFIILVFSTLSLGQLLSY